MDQRWRFLHFYTAGTRKPILLALYRKLLKGCISFKQIDQPSGMWLFSEAKLQFRRNKNLKDIDQIIESYKKGLKQQERLEASINGDINNQKEILREGYGQKGSKKIDFLAAYCIENDLDFGNLVEKYSQNIPIPEEFARYLGNNRERTDLYEDLFEPKYNYEILSEENKEYKDDISWYLKVFLRRHQLLSVKDAIQEKRRYGGSSRNQ